MKAFGPFLTLICGVMVLVGFFLPWISFNFSAFSDMYGGMSYGGTPSLSGWDFIRHWSDLSGPGLSNYSEWLVLIGAILMIGSGMVIFGKYLREDQMQLSTSFSVMIAFTGVLLSIVGTMTYISDMNKVNAVWSMINTESFSVNAISYGVILSTVFAFLGIIGVATTFWKTRVRLSVAKPETSDAGTASVPPYSTTRQYYEQKAAEYASASTPVEDKPAMAAATSASVSSAATLPPLPPVIDDAAARECFTQAGELEKAGEREKAIEEYTKAIRLNSRHTEAYFKRGMLLAGIGFKPAAVADLRRVIDIADNPELSGSAKDQISQLG